MKGFLLDTHIWFWYLSGSRSLSPSLRRVIDQTRSDCWISPISLWELGILNARRRIALPRRFRQWMNEALEKFPLNEAPLNNEIALVSLEVGLTHPDPADRFLAATTIVYELVLMTVDERLTRARAIPTRSR